MKELIKIGEKEVKKMEYKNIPVITFNMIDELHKRKKGTARKTYNRNKKRFIENKDYFYVKPTDFQPSVKETAEIYNFGTYLLTESGYLKLVKSFRDDLAWKIQDILIEAYFKIKEYTKEEVDRIVSKEKRRELTDAIKESGLNEQMHGFAYKNFTELIYKLVFGMSSKKFKEAKGITGNLRDYLTPIQLTTIAKLENATKSFVDLGMKYHEIKVMLNNHLPDKIKEDCSRMIEI
jgi:hypothetical protein